MNPPIAVVPDAIPAELRGPRQWIGWLSVEGTGERFRLPGGTFTKPLARRSKPHKLPINPHTGNLAATDKSKTWGSFENAVAARERFKLSGIGFVFTADDDFVGVDLDNCRDIESGVINPAAAAIISEFNSFTEISQSCSGVHVVVRAPGMPGPKHRTKYDGGEIEIYSERRFFAMTGQRLPDTPSAVERREAELQQAYDRLFGRPGTPGHKNGKDKPPATHEDIRPVNGVPNSNAPAAVAQTGTSEVTTALTDEEVIKKALASRNGAQFAALYFGGDTSAYGGDESRADLALCDYFAFWCQNEAARIDALFRRSRLMRPKWDERRSSDGTTYGQLTTKKAINGTHKTYDAKLKGKSKKGDDSAGDTAVNGQPRPSQALLMVKLAEQYDYFHSPEAKPYVTFKVNGHAETHSVRSRAFKLHLQRLFYRERNSAISSKALIDAIGILEANARFDGPERQVFTRVAQHDGRIIVDAGGDDWAAYEISTEGWRAILSPSVRFVRPGGMRALPPPARMDGALDAFKSIMNFADAGDFKLLIGWLLGAFHPNGPYPILSFRSPHGSGKSSATKVARCLVDLHEVPTRTLPREEQDIYLAATHSWVVAFDNIGKIPDWFSDALCRLATGGGYGTRELYTNDEEFLFSATRPVVFNGITDAHNRTDLLDRLIQIELPEISQENRLTEAQFWKTLNEIAPGVVGALFDGLVEAKRNVSSIELPSLPRMADFATWVEAAAPAFGWGAGDFLNIYGGNRHQLTAAALQASPAGLHVLGVVQGSGEEWTGTATELLARIERNADKCDKSRPEWPRSPRAMSNVLRQMSPSLREAGVGVTFERDNAANRERIIRLSPVTPGTQISLFKKPDPEYLD